MPQTHVGTPNRAERATALPVRGSTKARGAQRLKVSTGLAVYTRPTDDGKVLLFRARMDGQSSKGLANNGLYFGVGQIKGSYISVSMY